MPGPCLPWPLSPHPGAILLPTNVSLLMIFLLILLLPGMRYILSYCAPSGMLLAGEYNRLSVQRRFHPFLLAMAVLMTLPYLLIKYVLPMIQPVSRPGICFLE